MSDTTQEQPEEKRIMFTTPTKLWDEVKQTAKEDGRLTSPTATTLLELGLAVTKSPNREQIEALI